MGPTEYIRRRRMHDRCTAREDFVTALTWF